MANFWSAATLSGEPEDRALVLSAFVDGRRAIRRWRRWRRGLGIFNGVIDRVRRHGEDGGKSGAGGGDCVFCVELQELRLGEIGGGDVEIEVALEGAFGQCRGKVLDIAPCRNCCFRYVE
jgi:hypothetical protein